MRDTIFQIYSLFGRLSAQRHFRLAAFILAIVAYLAPVLAAVSVAVWVLGWAHLTLPYQAWWFTAGVVVLGSVGWFYALYQLFAPVLMAQEALRAYIARNQAPHTDIVPSNNIHSLLAEFEQTLRYLTTHDHATRLPNRPAFEDQLRQTLAHARRRAWTSAVLKLELNGFQTVNYSLGHRASEQLIQAVSERLKQQVRETDHLSRLSEDRFGLLQTEVQSLEHLLVQVQRLLEAFRQPFTVAGREILLGLNIGIALFPVDSDSADQLLSHAGAALTSAKTLGRSSYQFYAAGLTANLQRKLELENDLRRACERGEMQVYYQPQVEVRTGQLTGLEVLLRWLHPRLGLVAPTEFIALAEETGYIVELGEWAMRRACEQWTAWRRLGLLPVKLAVNLSPRQLHQPSLVEKVAAILQATTMEPHWLELEITESCLVEDLPQAEKTLEALQALGVSIALDDFGSGYSSLNYLRRLPISTLKVDREFVKDLPTEANSARMLQGIQALARSLNIEVLVEGVETEAQLACLQTFGCERAQGFLLSRPVTAEVLGARLHKGKFDSVFGRVRATPATSDADLIFS